MLGRFMECDYCGAPQHFDMLEEENAALHARLELADKLANAVEDYVCSDNRDGGEDRSRTFRAMQDAEEAYRTSAGEVAS